MTEEDEDEDEDAAAADIEAPDMDADIDEVDGFEKVDPAIGFKLEFGAVDGLLGCGAGSGFGSTFFPVRRLLLIFGKLDSKI